MNVVRTAALLACAVGALHAADRAHADDGSAEKKGTMLKQDYVPPIFAPGPSVTDAGFDAWMRAQPSVKLPFTIWRKPRRIGAIGVHAAPPATPLRFSDGALGVPLDERLRQLCGSEDPCRVWLAGRIGESMPLPDPDPSTVFNVHAVHGRVEGDGPHHAQSPRAPACLAIRAMKPLHCARGPERCEKCKHAATLPATPRLLDVCPHGDYARPTVEIERGGKKEIRVYDVLQTFADTAEARAFATKHGITDVLLPE
jgi:hypothetical protein